MCNDSACGCSCEVQFVFIVLQDVIGVILGGTPVLQDVIGVILGGTPVLQDVIGVILGGTLGHALCTGLAVIGGRFVAQRISMRTGLYSLTIPSQSCMLCYC